MTTQRYHLPHNAIRIDEFDFLLGCINTERLYYTYAELRSLFLFEQIRQRKLESFHERYHQNLTTHSDPEVSALYARIVQMSADQLQPEDTDALLGIQYTQAKTFKQVWNETIRDYTEFFAFLGLLPSYYKGRRGDDGKRHYVSGLLCRYRNGEASMHDILMGFKYRNACKNEANFDMYSIEVRPFYIALRALQHYNAAGYHIVDPHIISAVVTFAQDENASLQKLLCDFNDPTLPLEDYQNLGLFPQDQREFQKWVEEARRASSLLKPYLEALQAVSVRRAGRSYKYVIQPEHFHLDKTPERSVFCDGTVGHYRLTPMLGKVINRCQHFADIVQERRIGFNSLFDDNFTAQEKVDILKELQAQGAVKTFDVVHSEAVLNIRRCQLAINPYCDMMGIEDANYVDNIGSLHLDSSRIDFIEDCDIQPNLDRLAQIARQSDGTAYENALFDLINQHLTVFRNRQHYGTQATGQRLSDIAFTAPIKNSDGQDANILVIIECKAGNAVRAFDERKERDDIINVVNRYNEQRIDYAGIWYWVADSDALPTEGAHGGSRASNLSKSFAEKLNDLQFTITELSRVPTIVTAFSITALTTYLRYLYQHTNNGHDKVITKLTVPHFWRWSKHFMHLQYITIHHNLNSLNQ